jgi:hypothetical protein
MEKVGPRRGINDERRERVSKQGESDCVTKMAEGLGVPLKEVQQSLLMKP